MDNIDIKIMRIKAGLKGYELAGMAGITPDKMSKIETGRENPSNQVLEALTKACKKQTLINLCSGKRK
ncbi:MAG: helix-turn-helix domain-containing protein [Deltaproteobacteria bacterium]